MYSDNRSILFLCRLYSVISVRKTILTFLRYLIFLNICTSVMLLCEVNYYTVSTLWQHYGSEGRRVENEGGKA